MDQIRILMVIGSMGLGGAEAMIMNLYRAIDRDKIQFDFLVHKNANGDYEDEILSLGGKIYRIDKYYVKNYFSYVMQLKAHFSAHPEHKIVHCHIGSAAAVCLSIAKKFGAYTIAHSHSTHDTINDLHSRLWFLNSYPTRFVADHFFACSKEAAIDRFGKKVAASDKCDILYNGIDCDRFAFNEENRNDIRKEYGIENNYVIGHVGRHTPPKNPLFLLEVFAEVYRKDPTARLLQVGQGELTEQMTEKCRELHIEEAVIFVGAHIDVEKYYSAMAVFLFPSLWEGLPVTLVEAQANGLAIIVSDSITTETDFGLGNYYAFSYNCSATEWAEKVLKLRNSDRILNTREIIKMAGYDAKDTADKLLAFYCEVVNQNWSNKYSRKEKGEN